MSVVLSRGILALSIDLELDAQRRGQDQQGALEQISERLVALLRKYRLRATWAVADPAISAATERLMAIDSGYEMAILGDHSWAGREAGRSRFARELTRRAGRARAVGLPVSTLVLRDGTLDEHLDLVVKQGITALRGAYDATTDASWFATPSVEQPRSPRYSLWQLPASQRLPGTSRWRSGGGGAAIARQGIDQAVAANAVYHLMIDGLMMAAAGVRGERVLEKVLRHAERRREQGVLEVHTLAGTAERLSGDRHATPARSILRPAA